MKRDALAEREAWLATVQRIMPDDCWNWPGKRKGPGYAMVYVRGVGAKPVHRVIYERVKGPIPSGLILDHLCRNPRCCNPDHLEPVTQRENVMRGRGITAAFARQTHCIHGHLLDEANTHVYPPSPKHQYPHWRCRECGRRWSREYAARHPEARKRRA